MREASGLGRCAGAPRLRFRAPAVSPMLSVRTQFISWIKASTAVRFLHRITTDKNDGGICLLIKNSKIILRQIVTGDRLKLFHNQDSYLKTVMTKLILVTKNCKRHMERNRSLKGHFLHQRRRSVAANLLGRVLRAIFLWRAESSKESISDVG